MNSPLNYKVLGTGDPIIFIHGLFGLLDNWITIAKQFSEKYQVWLIDQRNHGLSPHFESHTYDDLAADLDQFIEFHSIKKPILLGHSMGGKTVMKYALLYPHKIKGIIVVDIAPKAYRIHHNDIFDAIIHLPVKDISSRKEAETFFRNQIGDEKIELFILKNLSRDKNNRFFWKINVEALVKNIESICSDIQEYEDDVFEGPALFLRGEKSDYIRPGDEIDIKRRFPFSEVLIVKNADHWVHADNPADFFQYCVEFLQSIDKK